LTFEAVLRRADEHLDQVIVQTIVELALEAPFKLRMIQVARVQLKIVGMHRDDRVLELDNDFHRFALGAGIEIE